MNTGAKCVSLVAGLGCATLAAPVRADEEHFPPPSPPSPPFSAQPADVQQLFVPSPFHAGEAVKVVVAGVLPDGCWTLTDGESDIDLASRQISVAAKAVDDQPSCDEAPEPYTFVFDLGRLPPGDYTVTVPGTSLAASLVVRDDTYPLAEGESLAAVSDVFIQTYGDDGRDPTHARPRQAIILGGSYANICLRWARTPLTYGDTGVIDLAPVLKRVEAAHCDDTPQPFHWLAVDLPPLERGMRLLRVRLPDGRALYRVFEGGGEGGGREG